MFLRAMLNLLGREAGEDGPPTPVCAQRSVPAQAAVSNHADASGETEWSEARRAFADALWGQGFILPGGAEEVLRLAKPLGLSSASSLLLVGAGAGGPPRCLAEGLGAWVSAFETDPLLVGAGVRRCAAAGLGKRAQIAVWNPGQPSFAERFHHHAIALEPFRQAAPGGGFLPALARAVKPGGQIVMIEVVRGPSDGPALDPWLRAERRAHAPPDASGIVAELEKLRYEVRVAEDSTRRHLRLALVHWQAMIRLLRQNRPDATTGAVLLREAEAWFRRVRLMQDGTLRLVRFHALSRLTPG